LSFVAIAVVVLALLLAPAPASAAEIPRGDYTCSNSFGYAGTVNIKANNRYSVNSGKKHPYSYGRKRKILNFKKGPYRSFFGKYRKRDKAFDVYDNRSGDYLWACYR
jgi:hypothetical protein